MERSAANMPRKRVQRTARHDARGLGTDKAARPHIQRASGRTVKDAKEEICTRGGYQGGKDFWREDKSMRLSVEGNTMEKMIVEVGQERRGRYFCEREAR